MPHSLTKSESSAFKYNLVVPKAYKYACIAYRIILIMYFCTMCCVVYKCSEQSIFCLKLIFLLNSWTKIIRWFSFLLLSQENVNRNCLNITKNLEKLNEHFLWINFIVEIFLANSQLKMKWILCNAFIVCYVHIKSVELNHIFYDRYTTHALYICNAYRYTQLIL